jgi:NADPH:quinone reductase-like Zn-dependent oxidoreductase
MSTIRPLAARAQTTMRAVVHDSYGSADVLHVGEIDRPESADDEVLLAVHAAGLDRGTWHLMTGKPYLLRLAFGIRRPRNPVIGLDVAGTVVAVGSAVDGFAVGDEVFGFGRGTFAEYAVAKADQLARKPANVSFEAAAVVPVSASTALQALVDLGRVQPGNKVLVIGASGGVGSYAVQLAKAFGAEVTGVASTSKRDLVRSLGADHTLDYTTDDFADGRQHYDLILDIGGNARLSRLRTALTATGTAVLVGGEEGDSWTGGMGRVLRARTLSVFVQHRLTNFIARQRSSDLDTVTKLIETGAVTPTIDRSLPLAEAPAAMRLLEAGRVRGKVAIRVATQV